MDSTAFQLCFSENIHLESFILLQLFFYHFCVSSVLVFVLFMDYVLLFVISVAKPVSPTMPLRDPPQ